MSANRTETPDFRNRRLEATARRLENQAEMLEESCIDKRPSLSGREMHILGGIGPQMSAYAVAIISQWNRLDAALGIKPPRVVFMNCSNGLFADAFAVYDVLRISQENGGPDVTVQTTGMADTKAAIAMQAAKRRVMTPRSLMVLTEIATGKARMSSSDGRAAVKYMKWLENRGWKLLLKRAKGLTLEMIKEHTAFGRQWFLSAEEALQYGLIDEIGTVMPGYTAPAIDASLTPTDADSWQTRIEKAKLRLTLLHGELSGIVNRLQSVSAEKNGRFYFFGQVETEICAVAQAALISFAQLNLPEVELIINSPGGSVTDGMGLMDVVEQTTKGRKFKTTIFGEAASMAGFLALTGEEREMAENAAFLIHQVSTLFEMSSSHMADNAANMARLENMLFPYMVGRTGGLLTLADLKEHVESEDWWLTADECLKLGLVTKLI